MSTKKPRVTPTHIKGLLAGDKCVWAAWYRATHYRYKKYGENDFDSEAWRRSHNKLLRTATSDLESDGWSVSGEEHNEIRIDGENANVRAEPDLIAERGDFVRVIDGKTGKPNDKDVAQVRIYMALAPLQWPKLRESNLQGGIVYASAPHDIVPVTFTPEHGEEIFETIRRVSVPEPAQSPSRRECRLCDIAECGARHGGQKVTVSSGGAF